MLEELFGWVAKNSLGDVSAPLNRLVDGLLDRLPELTEVAVRAGISEICQQLRG